jgi:hypothetical protein
MTQQIAASPARPTWVDHLLEDLTDIEREIVAVQECVLAAGVQLRERGAMRLADDLNQAYHDSEHLWQHVTSARRALRMSWPDEAAAQG